MQIFWKDWSDKSLTKLPRGRDGDWLVMCNGGQDHNSPCSITRWDKDGWTADRSGFIELMNSNVNIEETDYAKYLVSLYKGTYHQPRFPDSMFEECELPE